MKVNGLTTRKELARCSKKRQFTNGRRYKYQPKQVDEIVVRAFAFEFPSDLDPKWSPGHVVRSHMFNGFSLTMPYLEPYLIKTMQEAAAYIEEPELLNDLRGFNGQEKTVEHE